MSSQHPIEKLWREVGLPEYFLGNGGTNTKLYELYDRILASCQVPDELNDIEEGFDAGEWNNIPDAPVPR